MYGFFQTRALNSRVFKLTIPKSRLRFSYWIDRMEVRSSVRLLKRRREALGCGDTRYAQIEGLWHAYRS